LHYDGSVWSAQATGTQEILFGICGAPGTSVYAVGNWGGILRLGHD
jgi:hypothetical protein